MSSTYGELLRDIKFGREYGEDRIQEFLLERFGMVAENVGAAKKGWDLEVTGMDVEYKKDKFRSDKSAAKAEKRFFSKYGRTFEVKRDFVSDRTGNFFYEVWSNEQAGNPGCMSTSKADTLVIVRRREFIFIDRAFFISWILDNIFSNTELGHRWACKTTGKKNITAKSKVSLRKSRQNKQLQGLLVPISDIKKIAIAVFK